MRQAGLALLLVLVVVVSGELVGYPFFYRDDQQAHFLPGFAEIAEAWRAGQLPWVSRYSWCAGGLLGEYQFALLNPIVQLAVVASSFVPDLALRDALLVAFFAWITAWGSLRLARDLNLDTCFGLSLAAIFCFNRFAMDVGWRSWLPMAIGATWIPWVWHACARRQFSLSALVISLYLVLNGGWPFAVVATATLGLFYFCLALFRRQWRRAGLLTIGALCALALSWPALGSLVEHSRTAIRPQGASWQYRLEIWDLCTYWLPGLIAQSRGMELVNLLTDIGWIPCLGILGTLLDSKRTERQPLWWLALLWCALGLSPSLAGMRFSFRWLNYLNPLMGLLGLLWLQRQAGNPNHRFTIATWAALLLAQVLGPLLDSLRGLSHRWEPGPILLLSAFCLAWNRQPQKRARLVLGGTLIGLLLAVPLTPISGHQYPSAPTPPNTLVNNQRVWLSLYTWEELQDPRAELVVSARYGNYSMIDRVEFVNGYSPLFVAPLIRAWTFSNVGSLDTNERARVNVSLGSMPGGLMDKLGISGLLLSPQWSGLGPVLLQNGWKQVANEGLVQVWTRGSGRIACFEPLKQANFRETWPATVEQALEPNGIGAVHNGPDGLRLFSVVECSREINERNRALVQISANSSARPALVAVHRSYLEGYRALLNGQPLKLYNLNLQQMAVEIPAGSQAGQLEVVYRPRSFDSAPWLALVAFLTLAATSKWRGQ